MKHKPALPLNGKKRRCTERCWRSLGTRCACVCGGKHHGTATRQLGLKLEDTLETAKG